MFRPSNDLVLHWLSKLCEIGAVSGYPDNEVFMPFRCLLGVFEYLPVDDIELDMFAVTAEIGTYQKRELP